MSASERNILDPWGSSDVVDYSKLFAEFGIEPISNISTKFPRNHRLLRRGMWFGHRDLASVFERAIRGDPYSVMSGIKPTGVFHLGTKTTAEGMVYFQSLSKRSTVFYSVADVEAYCDNGLKFSESHELAVSNLADILAIGLDPRGVYVYKQSEEKRVTNLASVFSKKVTNSMMHAIYGERNFGLYFSALVQVGDIMLPQLAVFGGPKPVVVPVGIDQDPHIRLARDLARRYHAEFGFVEPSAIFHRLVHSLSGTQKMSKRDPGSYLSLSDSPSTIRPKIMNALTGGRATAEEQRRLGGEPDKCIIYEYYRDHFLESDEELDKVRMECLTGKRLCGECKVQLFELIEKYITEHERKKRTLISKAQALLLEGSEIAKNGSEIF
jgi:tryptophanyl-tRNA synthetase